MTRQEYIDFGVSGITGRELISGMSKEFSRFASFVYSEDIGCIDAPTSIPSGSLYSGGNGEILTTIVIRGIQ